MRLLNNKDIHLDLLRKLEADPEYTQRALPRAGCESGAGKLLHEKIV